MSAGARLAAPPIVLDAVAATACPVKTRHAFESGQHRSANRSAADGSADHAMTHREAERTVFVADTLTRLLSANPRSADLRDIAEPDQRRSRTARLMRAGWDIIVGPLLPDDPVGHRAGAPEALLRSDGGIGRAGYHPLLVRWHKVLLRRRDDEPEPADAPEPAHEPDGARPWLAELTGPLVADESAAEPALRLETRRADFRQLAHHHRVLEAAGFAGAPWGAVIGTDSLPADPTITWVRLDRPVVRVVDHHAALGWRSISLLSDADTELKRRVAIADAVRLPGVRSADVAQPVVVDECRTCPWWSACRAELDPDDLSLRIARGRLDQTEVSELRSRGVTTVADLAAADVDALVAVYLPDVAHRADAERRVRSVARRARMLQRGEPIARETSGPIALPEAAVEIDLDIETSAAGRIYLWGFAVDRGPSSGVGPVTRPAYVQFSRFEELDEAGEEALAREALGWLRREVADAHGLLVFHYSGYEVAMIEALAARRPDDEVLAWASTYARSEFVDLLETVQANFFGAVGLGLKQIAVTAGFGWRDPDPGGLNSQRWFDQAVHGNGVETRAASRRRVLAYNEDDVRATAHLRSWLRAQ